jgi:hypothetical protein
MCLEPRIWRVCLFVAAAGLMTLSENVLAQQVQSVIEPIMSYQLAIGSAINSAAILKAPIQTPLKQLQKEVNTFEGGLNSGRTIGSEAMAANIKVSALALLDVQSKLSDPKSDLVVRALLEDIKLKNAATEFTFKLDGVPRQTPEVSVRINTMRGSATVDGYGAILVPFGYGEDKAWKDGVLAAIPPGASVTPKFTPKAVANVLPGLYWVQIYKAKRLASIMMKITIATEEIDVNVP